MTDPRPDLPAAPLDLASAARAFLCRSGHADTELRRRLLLRDTLRSSRALAEALADFVDRASVHCQDVHSTPHLDAPVDTLVRTLAEWCETIGATAAVYHECRGGTATPDAEAAHSPLLPGGFHARTDDLATAGEAL